MDNLREQALLVMELMARAFLQIKKNSVRVFRHHGLTGAQASVLSLLSQEEGKPMNKLSEQLLCDVSNVTGVVNRLEKQGYVWRASHPHDRRISLIGITAKGKATLAEVSPEHEKDIMARVRKLSAEERAILIMLLRKLSD